MSNSTNVQELYRREGEALFARLYREQRGSFINWAQKHFGCQTEDAIEVFQESMVVLYQKIKTRQLVEMKATLKTYLFAIGRNLLLKQYQLNSKTTDMKDLPEITVNPTDLQEELKERQLIVKAAMTQLGDMCREVLYLFYYRNFAIESIASQLNFKSEEVVRSKKYKCLKQLKKILNSKNILL